MQDIPTTAIGVLHAQLRLSVCHSLKEKRSIIRPVIHFLQDQFKLAVAEVADQDIWRSAVLAIAAVSADRLVVEQTLQNALDYLEGRPDFEVTDCRVEIF